MYDFNYFKAYSSVALNSSTQLCNHHHHMSQNFSSSSIEILSPLNTNSPFTAPLPQGDHYSTFCFYECKSKPQPDTTFIPIRVAVIKTTENNQCW